MRSKYFYKYSRLQTLPIYIPFLATTVPSVANVKSETEKKGDFMLSKVHIRHGASYTFYSWYGINSAFCGRGAGVARIVLDRSSASPVSLTDGRLLPEFLEPPWRFLSRPCQHPSSVSVDVRCPCSLAVHYHAVDLACRWRCSQDLQLFLTGDGAYSCSARRGAALNLAARIAAHEC